MSAETMGLRLRACRGTRTREAFAAELGCHPNTIKNVEQGHSRLFFDLAIQIAEAAGEDLNYLAYGAPAQGAL